MKKLIIFNIIVSIFFFISCINTFERKDYEYVLTLSDKTQVSLFASYYTEFSSRYEFYNKNGEIVFTFLKKNEIVSIRRGEMFFNKVIETLESKLDK